MEASRDRAAVSSTPPEVTGDTGDALASLAEEAERNPGVVTSAAQRDRARLAEEVEDSGGKSLVDSLCDLFGTDKESFKEDYPLLFAVVSLFSDEDSNDTEAEESYEAPTNLNIVNARPYELKESDLAGYNQIEINYLRTIAQAGISPRNANALYEQEARSSVDRPTFLKYLATTVEACAHFEVSPDRMLALIMSTMKMESSFNCRSLNESGATGLMQHMIGSIPERAEKLLQRGAITSFSDPYDTRFQIFASVQYFVEGMSSLGGDLNTYPPSKFGRDAYLIYNCGTGHAWLARIGAMEWSNEQLEALYRMPAEERKRRYGEDAGTFRDYAIRRLTRENTTFDRVQANYTRYRNILYGGQAVT